MDRRVSSLYLCAVFAYHCVSTAENINTCCCCCRWAGDRRFDAEADVTEASRNERDDENVADDDNEEVNTDEHAPDDYGNGTGMGATKAGVEAGDITSHGFGGS